MQKAMDKLNRRVLAVGGNEGHTQKLIDLSVELSGRTGLGTKTIIKAATRSVGFPRESALAMLKQALSYS